MTESNNHTEDEIAEAWARIEDKIRGPHIRINGLWDLPSFVKERSEINAIKDFQDILKPDEISK